MNDFAGTVFRKLFNLRDIIPSLNSVTKLTKLTSKAATVERAIEYILSLRRELDQLIEDESATHPQQVQPLDDISP